VAAMNGNRSILTMDFHHAFTGLHHTSAGVHLVWPPFRRNSQDKAADAD